jgi:hypothetical protein
MCSEARSDTGKEVKRWYLGKEEKCGKQHLRECWTMQEYDVMNRLLGKRIVYSVQIMSITSHSRRQQVQIMYFDHLRLTLTLPVHCFMLGT